MDFVREKNRKYCFILGLIAGILCGAGDILIGYFGQSGTALFGGVVNTDIVTAPMWQFELSFIFGLVAAPLMWLAGSSMYLYIKEQAQGKYPAMLSLFSLGIKIMILYVAAAHSVCCIAMMCIKAALEQGMSAGSIESVYRAPLLMPFMATNIWITVSEFLVSAAYIYLAAKNVIKVPKILLIFNPICIYALSKIIGILVSILTKDTQAGQLFAGGASFGYGLMFLSGYLAAKGNKQDEEIQR
ncbi:MAG: hypothetical protein NC347_12915 [Clostridium sp.]|nr:hypothetical protein [Clostridium sp.]